MSEQRDFAYDTCMTPLRVIAPVTFPEPTGLWVNMMPFVIGDPDSIPAHLRQYQGLLDLCEFPESEYGRIGYLSICETFVRKGETQRRPGIHTEATATGRHGGGHGGKGVHMASNVAGTCRAWPIETDSVDDHGGCPEPIVEPVELEANTLYGMSDRVPHEALPQTEDGVRQWFRAISSDLAVWYVKHNTPNPLGVVPGPDVRVSRQSKFAAESEVERG
jgi:hypothetical protein